MRSAGICLSGLFLPPLCCCSPPTPFPEALTALSASLRLPHAHCRHSRISSRKQPDRATDHGSDRRYLGPGARVSLALALAHGGERRSRHGRTKPSRRALRPRENQPHDDVFTGLDRSGIGVLPHRRDALFPLLPRYRMLPCSFPGKARRKPPRKPCKNHTGNNAKLRRKPPA